MKLSYLIISMILLTSVLTFFSCSKKEKLPEGIIVIEAENTKSDLGKWIKIIPGDSNYVENARGKAHIEFTGNTINGGKADSPLEYTFTAPEDGVYRLLIRCHKRLEGAKPDKCNDGWVKLNGNFETGNDVPTEDLQKNEKFFGGAANNWGWADLLDWQGHIKKAALYKLKKGEKYTFTLSGRSIRWNVDYIVFYDSEKYSMDEAKLAIDPNSVVIDKTPDKWNMKVEGFSPAYYDKGNKAFAVNTIDNPTDQWAAANRKWDGEEGLYTINFTSLCELDGECSYKVLIDSVEIISYTNPRIHDTGAPDYAPHKVSVSDVALNKGSKIQVEFLPHSNELVPEHGAWAFARGRWRDIEITKQ